MGSGSAAWLCEPIVGGKNKSWVRSWEVPKRPKEGGTRVGAFSARLEVGGRLPDPVTSGSSWESIVGSIAAPGSWVSKTAWTEPARSGYSKFVGSRGSHWCDGGGSECERWTEEATS